MFNFLVVLNEWNLNFRLLTINKNSNRLGLGLQIIFDNTKLSENLRGQAKGKYPYFP